MEVPINRRVTINDRINKILSTDQGRVYFTLVATVIVVGMMLIFAILPAYTSITDQLAIMEQKKNYLSQLKNKIQTLGELNSQFSEYQNPIMLLSTYFGSKINTELVTASIIQIAENNDCVINNIDFTEISKSEYVNNPYINSVEFTLQARCPFEKVATYYGHMINYVIPISITSITYSQSTQKGGKSGTSIMFDMVVNGEYYYWKESSTQTNGGTS